MVHPCLRFTLSSIQFYTAHTVLPLESGVSVLACILIAAGNKINGWRPSAYFCPSTCCLVVVWSLIEKMLVHATVYPCALSKTYSKFNLKLRIYNLKKKKKKNEKCYKENLLIPMDTIQTSQFEWLTHPFLLQMLKAPPYNFEPH
jgi:hypothetical protein